MRVSGVEVYSYVSGGVWIRFARVVACGLYFLLRLSAACRDRPLLLLLITGPHCFHLLLLLLSAVFFTAAAAAVALLIIPLQVQALGGWVVQFNQVVNLL